MVALRQRITTEIREKLGPGLGRADWEEDEAQSSHRR